MDSDTMPSPPPESESGLRLELRALRKALEEADIPELRKQLTEMLTALKTFGGQAMANHETIKDHARRIRELEDWRHRCTSETGSHATIPPEDGVQ